MSKYHKNIKLLTLLNPFKTVKNKLTGLTAIVLLTSLSLNFLFPHIALAKDIGRNNVLSFNFLETASISPFILAENNISLAKITDIDGEEKKNRKVYMLPVEPVIAKVKANKIIILTLAKKVNMEEKVVAISKEENDKIAEEICVNAGLTDLPCWQDLKAMREKESYDGKEMTGDYGKSRGWYHIQIKLHDISDDCALDFKCSTEWTVKNLITNSYKINRFYAISRHNGGGAMAQNYARSVVYNSAKFGK